MKKSKAAALSHSDTSNDEVSSATPPPRSENNPSGNPNGQALNQIQPAEQVVYSEAEALIRKAIHRANQGDSIMLRLLIERILPPRPERPLQFSILPLDTPADAVAALKKIAGAFSRGELTESEARTFTNLVNTILTAFAAVNTEARLEAIEQRLESRESVR